MGNLYADCLCHVADEKRSALCDRLARENCGMDCHGTNDTWFGDVSNPRLRLGASSACGAGGDTRCMQFCMDAGAEGTGETELIGCKKTHQAYNWVLLFWWKAFIEEIALIARVI